MELTIKEYYRYLKKRDRQIVYMFLDGAYTNNLVNKYGISMSRIRQIIKNVLHQPSRIGPNLTKLATS